MQKIIQPEADVFLAKKRRRRRWAKVVSVLGCVVVFCTTYALILPAITAEKTICGFEEHTHTDECYAPLPEEVPAVLSCTYESLGVHSHTETCYDADGNLICGQADYVIHSHDENCYDAEGTLVCTLPERAAHVHTDACYTAVEEGHAHSDACYELQQGGLICTLEENEEHQHGPDCYEQILTLVCPLEEQPVVSVLVLTCGEAEAPVHQHTESCFETVEPVRELICELPEHVHTEACYEELTPGDPTADLETAADWEASVSGVVLTGDYRTDLLAIAETQLGYRESTRNFIIDEAGFVKGYTRYGQWYGIPYGDWCAMFVSFCLHYAGIPETAVPYESGCANWVSALSAAGLYRPAGMAAPVKGDIIFFDNDGDGSADHVGLVAGVTEEEPSIKTIEGNSADRVQYLSYNSSASNILGYAEIPAEPDAQAQPEADEATDNSVGLFAAVLSGEDTTAGPITVDPYITGASLYYRNSSEEDWTKATEDTTIPGTAELKLEVNYKEIQLSDLLSNGGRLQFTVPPLLRNPTAEGTITDDDGNVIGTVNVADNVLTIDFDETWLQEQEAENITLINGSFYITSQINYSEVGEDGQNTITIGSVTIEAEFEADIVAKNADVDVTKAVSEKIIHEADGDYLEYTLTVKAGMDGCPEVSVKDSFTANGNYVSYVGLSDTEATLADSGSPCETIAAGKTHGSILQDSEGKLVWKIGDMAPNETRTLTYRVKLGEGYTYIQNSSSKVISNEAQVYALQYPRDKVTANFEPKAGLNMKKTASDAVRQEDGSYIITYTVWVEAYSTNHFVLENVRIEDRLNHPNNATASASLEYISYVDGSFVLYDNKTPTGDPLAFETSEEIPSNPAMNEDKKGFTAYVGDMAPGDVYCIQYQVHVGLEAIGEAGGKTLDVKNRALAYSDNAKNGGNDWLQAYSNTKNIRYDHWAKKLVGTPLTEDAVVPISGTVYDATGDKPVVESSPPASFTAPVGSYQYTVTVNDLGDWDVTSASMKDTLGDQHMQFVGYVRVEAYDPDDNNAVKETIWVKIDGTQTFNFTLAQLGLTKNTYAYRLTYFAKPVQMEGVSQVVVANTFQFSGDIIIGEGYRFLLTGIEASAEVTVQGDNSFEAEKRAWYYEGAKTSTGNWSKGALYWAIKVDGTNIVAGTYIQDYLQTGSHYSQIYSDSFVGIYTSALTGSALTSYGDLTEALNSGNLTPVDASYYSVETETNRTTSETSPPSTLTVKMEKTLSLDGQSMYIILKTSPSFLPPHPFFGSPLYYHNNLRTSDDGQTWIERGKTSKVLYEGTNIWKRLGTTFTYDGTSIVTKTSVRGGTVIKDLLPEPGYYVSWEVKVNESGDLSGKYRLVDTIPEGMELAYVRLKWRGTGARSNPGAAVTQITDLGDGWTEHTVSAGLDGEMAKATYFYTNGNQVCWDVDNLVAGKAADTYSVDFQVVCRVTDPDVLLGGEEKTFNNQVSLINSRGEQHDADTNGVTISTSTMTKSAVWSGSSIPFTITVNPLGEDLLEGAETLTIVDTLSGTLKLDPTSLEVKNTKTQEAVDFTASLDGQILKIIVPDNQPLTVYYRAKVQAAPNTEVAIKNDAHWEGYAVTGGSSTENARYKYSVGGTAGGTTTPYVEIVKYDQNNLTHFLAGAAFEMVEGTMEDGVFTPGADKTWTGTTDAQGKLKFGTDPLMAYNTVYRITETAPPPGYVLDGSPSYFIVAKANKDGIYPAYPDGVTVYYDSSTYTCEIGNHKGEATVEKRFSDPENQSVEKVNGTYRFGIYNTAEPDGAPLQTVVITIQNGSAANTGKFTGLDLGETYYIYELDDEGMPVSDGTLAMVDGKLFDVTYGSGPAVTVPQDGTAAAAVTVTNQVHYTALPQTGGAGTRLYTMGGLLLVAAASLLLLYNHTRRRKEDSASS